MGRIGAAAPDCAGHAEPDGDLDEVRRRALIDELAPEYLSRPSGMTDEAIARHAVATMLRAASGPWFRFFLTYDPRPALARVRCPVLAIIGEHDVQVPARENLPAIDAALKSGGNTDHTVTSLPRLNHLFQTSTTGSPVEYAAIEETFSPGALRLISSWIQDRVRRPAG